MHPPVWADQELCGQHQSGIPLTDWYISEWGLHMVPLDVRRAIADVRSCLGLSNVLWPAILYRDDDVGPDVIVPDCVDSFGMVLED